MTVVHRIAHGSGPAWHARSGLGAPGVISDEMPPTQSMLDGKYYTSKAALRATYRPSGNREGARFVEVGNDPALLRPRPKPAPDRKAIRQAVGRAFARAGFGG
jgi:hypothetical protein